MPSRDRPRIFLLTAIVMILLIVGHVFYLNYLFDPWWHFNGNKSGGDKYTFNDKEAKINKFHYDNEEFDCVIFGNSRALTFNEHVIDKHTCFNFSLSGADLPVILSYAEYFRRYVPNPELVVVSVDERLFYDIEGLCSDVPADYTLPILEKPGHWYGSYFSVDAFRFSKRLAANHRVVIGRDSLWHPVVSEPRNSNSYDFKKWWKHTNKKFIRRAEGKPPKKSYSARCVPFLEGFRALYPQARIFGYVPPTTPDLVVHWYAQDNLETILEIFFKSAKYFDRFLDFSVPSEFTRDASLTWDGVHFKPPATDIIVNELVKGQVSISLDLKKLTRDRYREMYYKRIASLVSDKLPEFLDEKLTSFLSHDRDWED